MNTKLTIDTAAIAEFEQRDVERVRQRNSIIRPTLSPIVTECVPMLAKFHTFSLLGIDALPVEVQVDVSPGALPIDGDHSAVSSRPSE